MRSRFRRSSSAPPPLAGRLGPFPGFSDDRSRQAQIVAALRPLAHAARARWPAPFHTVREVCAHFGVSLWTAGAVFRSLEQEGLLARLRGAGTVVPGRTGGCRLRPAARGSVAIVNWLPGFLYIVDQRMFVTRLEKRLRDRGFVCENVLYHEEDKRSPALAERILAHRPDFAVWLTPGAADESTLDALSDAGVRVAAVADRPVKTRTPQYVIDWRQGFGRALRAWRQDGIDRVTVPVHEHRDPPRSLPLSELAPDFGLDLVLFPVRHEAMDHYVTRLQAEPGGIFFDLDMWHARVCVQAPQAFARLLARRRVLCDRSLPIDPRTLGSARVDMLDLPRQRIADRIADDINSGAILRMTDDEVFRPAWRPRVPAARFAHSYAFENI